MKHSIIERSTDDLPEGELLIQVHYSSLNYKDGMSARGLPGVTEETVLIYGQQNPAAD